MTVAGDSRRNSRRPPGGGRHREQSMVPRAEFTSYYGRPIVKPSPWSADIPGYLFLGGLAAGSSLLAAGSDLTGRLVLRRSSRLVALASVTASFAALVHDLGRPGRFHHMLRVAKVTSPMSVGTWILTAYGPMAALAAASEGRKLLPRWLQAGVAGDRLDSVGRGAGLAAAALAPALASYTAVLLSDTATPTWYDGRRQLPFVFVASASLAAGGAGMVAAPLDEARPARALAIGAAAVDLGATHRMESSMGLSAEPLRQGKAGRYMKAAKALTLSGGLLAAALGRRSRPASMLAGTMLVAASACTRFGIFHAGQQSALDPRYTVVPQRHRVDEGHPIRSDC